MHNIQVIKKARVNYPPFGPVVWLDGADASSMTIATTISQWNDKSGHGFNAVQASAGLQPALLSPVLNNRTAVSFGGAQGMSIPAVSLSTFIMFFVFRATANGFLYEQSVDSNANNGGYMYTDTTQTVRVNRIGGASNRNFNANWGLGNTWRIVAHSFGGSNVENRLMVNNAYQSITDFVTTADPGTSTVTDTLFLASRNNASVFLTGDIAEILVYSPILAQDRVNIVNAYLNQKWAIY